MFGLDRGFKSLFSLICIAALGLGIAGCESETESTPKMAPNANDVTQSNSPVIDDAPATPPPQSEPETTASSAPRAVSADELKTLVAEGQGKVVLVDFWATWCAPCVKQFPHTVELSKVHAADLVVLAVAMNQSDADTLAEVEAFYNENNSGNVQPLISADGDSDEAYQSFEITGGALPHYKVYGRDGELIQSFGGDPDKPLDPAEIDKAIEAAIAKKAE